MGTLFAAYSMRFANATKGYACGSYNLGVTSDGAATWKLSFFAGKVFRDISVVDANTAYAVGDQGLMKKTTDGGVTWSDVPHNIPPGTYNTGFNSVYFTSASEGWVTADVGIYHTIDAGLTWTQELSLIGSHYAIWMINNNKGFMCSVTSGGSMYVYGSGN
ncbi:MAG: YCF48-related protein, partial [Ignavibacteriaceae bacterium]